MDIIKFVFDETNEEVNFAVIGSVEYNEDVYLMVVEEEELDQEDMTAYILKSIEVDDEEVVYEIVDDEEELGAVTELFEEILENFELEQN
jgi:acetylornithine deacetylase/succinyl-diaminopimelate desuccinylase-like protein